MSFANFFTNEEITNIRNSNFLIIGGAGYIGSHVAQLLVSSGAKLVKVIDNLSSEGSMRRIHSLVAADNFDFIKCGVDKHHLIEEIVENDEINYVLYLANNVGLGTSIDDPMLIAEEYENFLRILNISKAWADAFIYGSSSLVYGENYNDNLKLKEDDICEPLTPFAAMKLACETIAKSYTNLYGFPTLGLRYFEVYGTDQKMENQVGEMKEDLPLISQYIKNIVKHKDVELDSTYRDVINMCNIQDCAIITTKAMFNVNSAQILNVGGADNISKQELVKLLLVATESPSNIIINKFNNLERIADPLLEEEDVETITEYNVPDLTKMAEIIGYEPQVPLMNGIIELMKHYIKTILYKSEAINAIEKK